MVARALRFGCQSTVYLVFGMCTLGYVLRDGHTFCSADLNSYGCEDRKDKLMQNLHSKAQVWNRRILICRVGSNYVISSLYMTGEEEIICNFF